ncbi:hypothetical protein EVAR_29272_1 [Eumeta japonica]|uniref:Uncharacterized protein n=1 Tax=Eumeta variegata TaxID=151549 RepID=A0A4C1VW85_EUMVA|nr:hypothetical protein EVAR_29272_1 [Eumeta japonica]
MLNDLMHHRTLRRPYTRINGTTYLWDNNTGGLFIERHQRKADGATPAAAAPAPPAVMSSTASTIPFRILVLAGNSYNNKNTIKKLCMQYRTRNKSETS